VWIGDGNQLWRETVGDDGLPERRSTVSVIGMEKGDVLRAVRISPDGVRIAMVQATRGQPEGTLVIGSIVRSNGRVTVEAPEKISPQNESITDVAWQTSVRLIAIGHVGSSEDARTFDTHVDGSSWTSRPVNLFSEPTQVAATVDAVPWLSAGGFVWEQQSDSWVPPTGGQTPGTAPVYVE
jgi:hypothetical protein